MFLLAPRLTSEAKRSNSFRWRQTCNAQLRWADWASAPIPVKEPPFPDETSSGKLKMKVIEIV